MRLSPIILASLALTGCVSEIDKCISQELKVGEAQRAVSFKIWDKEREDQWDEYKKRFCIFDFNSCDVPPEARLEFDRLYEEKNG